MMVKINLSAPRTAVPFSPLLAEKSPQTCYQSSSWAGCFSRLPTVLCRLLIKLWRGHRSWLPSCWQTSRRKGLNWPSLWLSCPWEWEEKIFFWTLFPWMFLNCQYVLHVLAMAWYRSISWRRLAVMFYSFSSLYFSFFILRRNSATDSRLDI